MSCGHIQLDSLLNDEETAKGCHAYYIEEALRTTKEDQFKNCERNFRRGVVFGYKLKKKKIFPRSVLELGPGTGYFSAGLQFVIPGLQITVMDVNNDVLKFNNEQHGYETIKEIPDNFTISLRPGGLFHFITPNGKEDVWGHFLTKKFTNAPSELLINHVNYFDGAGLKDLLINRGFLPVEYFTYTVKTAIRGQGWKVKPVLMSPLSTKKSADFFINVKASKLPDINFDKARVLDKWYIQNNSKWITWLYCLYHHFTLFRISPERNIGHEIYGLFKKA